MGRISDCYENCQRNARVLAGWTTGSPRCRALRGEDGQEKEVGAGRGSPEGRVPGVDGELPDRDASTTVSQLRCSGTHGSGATMTISGATRWSRDGGSASGW